MQVAEAQVQTAAVAEVKEASELLALSKSLTLQNQAHLEFAVTACAEVKDKAKAIVAQRDEFVAPLKETIAKLTAFFAPALNDLAAAEVVLKDAIIAFKERNAVERDKLLSAVSEAPDEATRTAVIAEADAHDVPDVSGLSTRTYWIGEVVDADKIPRQYLTPDLKMLAAVTKAKDGDPKIPGWKAYPKSSATITSSRVKR